MKEFIEAVPVIDAVQRLVQSNADANSDVNAIEEPFTIIIFRTRYLTLCIAPKGLPLRNPVLELAGFVPLNRSYKPSIIQCTQLERNKTIPATSICDDFSYRTLCNREIQLFKMYNVKGGAKCILRIQNFLLFQVITDKSIRYGPPKEFPGKRLVQNVRP